MSITSKEPVQGSRLVSVGTALPPDRLTNNDLEQMMETSDEWIMSRTGIRERRRGGTTTGLAAAAAEVAVERSGVDRDEIDLVIVATQTPDDLCPSTAAGVQHVLGVEAGAFDQSLDLDDYLSDGWKIESMRALGAGAGYGAGGEADAEGHCYVAGWLAVLLEKDD